MVGGNVVDGKAVGGLVGGNVVGRSVGRNVDGGLVGGSVVGGKVVGGMVGGSVVGSEVVGAVGRLVGCLGGKIIGGLVGGSVVGGSVGGNVDGGLVGGSVVVGGKVVGGLVGGSVVGGSVGGAVGGPVGGSVVGGSVGGSVVGGKVVGGLVGGSVVGRSVGDNVGDAVGSEVVGDVVGAVGDAVGSEVVGDVVGAALSSQQVFSQITPFSWSLQFAGIPPIKRSHNSSEMTLIPQVGAWVGPLTEGGTTGAMVKLLAMSHVCALIAATNEDSWLNSLTSNTLSPVGADAMATSSLESTALIPTARIVVSCDRTSAAAAEASNPLAAGPSMMAISTLGTPALSARACGSTVLFTSSKPSEVSVAPLAYGAASMAARSAAESVCAPNATCSAALVANDARLTRNEPSASLFPPTSTASAKEATKGRTNSS